MTQKKLLKSYSMLTKKTDVITFRANDALCWFRSMKAKLLPEAN
jgi:hypothetical protein